MEILKTQPKKKKKHLLELISELSKAAGYKINMQKSVAFLYTNNSQKKKLRKSSPFTTATK